MVREAGKTMRQINDSLTDITNMPRINDAFLNATNRQTKGFSIGGTEMSQHCYFFTAPSSNT
jgi:hypothetical protein